MCVQSTIFHLQSHNWRPTHKDTVYDATTASNNSFFVARTVNSEYMRRTENREGLVANLHYNRTKRLFIQCVGIQVTLSDYYSLSSPPTLLAFCCLCNTASRTTYPCSSVLQDNDERPDFSSPPVARQVRSNIQHAQQENRQLYYSNDLNTYWVI